MEKDDSELGLSLLSMSVGNVGDKELATEKGILEVIGEGFIKGEVLEK